MKTIQKKGISIIEILVVVAIISITFVSVLGLATFSLQVSILMKGTTQAKDMAQEVIEQVRNFRDGTTWNADGLGSLRAQIPYHPEKTTGDSPKWQLLEGEETTRGFIKKVVFDNVQRDDDKNIVESGGTDDPDTKKITVTVSWEKRGTRKVEIITYLTNWR